MNNEPPNPISSPVAVQAPEADRDCSGRPVSRPAQQFAQPLTLNLQFAPNPADTALAPVGQSLPAASQLPAVSVVPQLSTVTPQPNRKPRNGKIARLPKPVREVVNRMLFNHVSQEKIVGALKEIGIQVTQRNISNWKTHGGYREWCLAQEHAVQLRMHQDNLVDLIRRHDASELPEVGLQLAATQLSQFFLTPAAQQLLASDPKEYQRRVSMLNSISAQLKALQQYRDDSAKGLGYKNNPARIRRDTTAELEKLRYDWSGDAGKGPKEPFRPHRNDLPNPAELFHCAPEESKPAGPTFEEILEAMQRASAAKRQLTNGALAKPTDATS